jgi:hypothetical protein
MLVGFSLVMMWNLRALATEAVIESTNETFVQYVVAQAGTSTSVTSAGPLLVQSCTPSGSSFDPVGYEVMLDANDLPIQTVYFEWAGGAGYEDLEGTCTVKSSNATQSFNFYIPITFAVATAADGLPYGLPALPVTAQLPSTTSSIPSECDFGENLGVVNSQTPAVSTHQENLQVYALANPSASLSADQIPAVGVDIQGLYNGFTVDNWTPEDGGCCGGAPFLIRVMCSTLAHFQTNS